MATCIDYIETHINVIVWLLLGLWISFICFHVCFFFFSDEYKEYRRKYCVVMLKLSNPRRHTLLLKYIYIMIKVAISSVK